MVVWSVLALAFVFALTDATTSSGITTVGSKKLATVADCSGVVAFSGTKGSIKEKKLILSETLVDKGVGYAAETGTFTTHCPGLYQFSFSGYGSSDLKLTLNRKPNKSDAWTPVVRVGPGGGSSIILLDVETGDQLAIFVESGKVNEEATFSGHRVAKK